MLYQRVLFGVYSLTELPQEHIDINEISEALNAMYGIALLTKTKGPKKGHSILEIYLVLANTSAARFD